MRTLAAVLAALLALATPHAHAQNLRAEALTEHERHAVILTLRIAGDDIDTLDAFAAATTVERRAIIDQHRPRITKAWSDQREAAQRGETPDMRIAMGSIWDARAALDDAQTRMINDLVLTLGGDREAEVDRCLSRLYRMRTMPPLSGSISGLAADPLIVAYEVGVPAALDNDRAARFQRAMLSYDGAIERHLRAFDDLEREASIAFSVPGFDDLGPVADDYFARTIEIAAEIKQAHRERCEAIAATLPDDLRSRWHAAWLRLGYPDVYAPHYIEHARDRLLATTTLTDDEREAVEALTSAKLPTLDRARRALRQAIDDHEASATPDTARNGVRPVPDDLTDARERVRELAVKTHVELLALIDEERHELVPPLPDRSEDADT
ncbi:MAG: hypothetical protein AAGH64_02330 [Planctomycetota bacterium]